MATFISFLVSAVGLVLIMRVLVAIFAVGGGSTDGTPDSSESDDDLPPSPSGQWDPRKAWGRWEDPLERERYYQARGQHNGIE